MKFSFLMGRVVSPYTVRVYAAAHWSFSGYSEMSKNLAKQYENDQIDEKNEEIRDIYEIQNQYESDAEYDGYANDDEVKEFIYIEREL